MTPLDTAAIRKRFAVTIESGRLPVGVALRDALDEVDRLRDGIDNAKAWARTHVYGKAIREALALVEGEQ